MHDHADVAIRQHANRSDHVDRVAAQPIQFRHDQRFTIAHPAQHVGEAGTAHRMRASADRVFVPIVDAVASLFEFQALIGRGHHVIVLADAQIGSVKGAPSAAAADIGRFFTPSRDFHYSSSSIFVTLNPI